MPAAAPKEGPFLPGRRGLTLAAPVPRRLGGRCSGVTAEAQEGQVIHPAHPAWGVLSSDLKRAPAFGDGAWDLKVGYLEQP